MSWQTPTLPPESASGLDAMGVVSKETPGAITLTTRNPMGNVMLPFWDVAIATACRSPIIKGNVMLKSIKEFFCSESFKLGLFCAPGAALGSYMGLSLCLTGQFFGHIF